jgi:hypothetical protein
MRDGGEVRGDHITACRIVGLLREIDEETTRAGRAVAVGCQRDRTLERGNRLTRVAALGTGMAEPVRQKGTMGCLSGRESSSSARSTPACSTSGSA